MERSKNFRIDALLADETHRSNRDLSPGLSNDSPAGSPVSCRRADTPSPRGTPGLIQLQTGIIPKPGLLNLSHTGLTSLTHGAIPGMYPTPMYPISALGGQHPAFAYSGFTQLAPPYPEHLKAATMAGSFPLEHWIRAGIMVPRLPEFASKFVLMHLIPLKNDCVEDVHTHTSHVGPILCSGHRAAPSWLGCLFYYFQVKTKCHYH